MVIPLLVELEEIPLQEETVETHHVAEVLTVQDQEVIIDLTTDRLQEVDRLQ
jgi:hypothetical protein